MAWLFQIVLETAMKMIEFHRISILLFRILFFLYLFEYNKTWKYLLVQRQTPKLLLLFRSRLRLTSH